MKARSATSLAMNHWYPHTSLYPNLCPCPLKFPVPRPSTPELLPLVPAAPCCAGGSLGGITVPNGLRISTPCPPVLRNKFLNHAGVSNRLPPCRGHSSVKKRCKCAPNMPV